MARMSYCSKSENHGAVPYVVGPCTTMGAEHYFKKSRQSWMAHEVILRTNAIPTVVERETMMYCYEHG
jgi:hypothetical protein